MPRPKVRFDMQQPALRPVASPVDTFYQPQPQIPAAAVDNQWLRLAKAMETLSPAISNILKAREGQAKEQGPGEAAKFRRAWFNPTEKQIKSAFNESVAENRTSKIDQGEPYAPVFDLKTEREKLITYRVSQAKLFSNMGREEAAKWLKENQATVSGGVVLNYAARPDFQLNLQKLMGGGFAKRAKIFIRNPETGELDTYENALGARLSELAASDDPDAWMREFEAPLQEGIDPAKGQGFLLGAIEGLAGTRQRLRAYAQQERLSNNAKVAFDEMVAAGVEIGNGWGNHVKMTFLADDPIPPDATAEEKLVIQERNKARRENAQKSQSGFVEWFWGVSLDASHPSKKRQGIQSKAIQQIAEGYLDIDPDGDLADDFLDFIRNIPMVEGAKKTLGELRADGTRSYWDNRLREISDALDRSRRSKRESTKQANEVRARSTAENSVLELIASDDESGDKLKAAHYDTLTEMEWMEVLGTPEFQAGIWDALVAEGGEEYADKMIYKITGDLAAQFGIDRTRRAGQTTAAQEETYAKLHEQIMFAGGTADVRNAIKSSGLLQNQKSQLYQIWRAEESQGRARLDYKGVEKAVFNAMVAGLGPDKLPDRIYRQVDALIQADMQSGLREVWRDSTDEERAKLRATLPTKLAKELHESKAWKDLITNSITRDPEVLFGVYGPKMAKRLEQEIIEAFPETSFKEDSNGNVILGDDDRPIVVQHKNVARNRRMAQRRATKGIYAWISEQKIGDAADIQQWGPQLINNLEGEALNKIIDNAIAPAARMDTQQLTTAPSPERKAVIEDTKAFHKRAQFEAGMKNAPLRVGMIGGIRRVERVAFADKWITDNIGNEDYAIFLRRLDESLDQAVKEQTIEIKSDDITGDIWTAQDQAYIRYIGPPYKSGDMYVYREQKGILKDNPNYPSNNGAEIFWLSSRALDIGKQADNTWPLSWEGDWLMEMGVKKGELTPSQSRKKLAGKIMARGLWLEEIIAGKTMEGIPLADLGWKDASDIPWKGVLIGRRDSAVHQKDMDAFMDTKTGQIRDGWEKTLIGQALTKMSIDPTAEVPNVMKPDGNPLTMWDMYLQRQGDLRKLMVGVRGQQNLTNSDRWSHDIQRFDSNAPHGHRFIGDSSQAKEKGNESTDWRIFNPTYRKMNERTRETRVEFDGIRNKAGEK